MSTGSPVFLFEQQLRDWFKQTNDRVHMQAQAYFVKHVGGLLGEKGADLESAATLNPVFVAIEADQFGFQRYSGSIVASGCGTSINHEVLAAGYDTTAILPG